MKLYQKLFFAAILLILIASCTNKPIATEKVCFSFYLVDKTHVKRSYTLPIERSDISIIEKNGFYNLIYIDRSSIFPQQKIIRAGVLDYEIIECEY